MWCGSIPGSTDSRSTPGVELGCWGKLMGERQKVRRVNQVGTLYKLSSLEQQPSEKAFDNELAYPNTLAYAGTFNRQAVPSRYLGSLKEPCVSAPIHTCCLELAAGRPSSLTGILQGKYTASSPSSHHLASSRRCLAIYQGIFCFSSFDLLQACKYWLPGPTALRNEETAD